MGRRRSTGGAAATGWRELLLEHHRQRTGPSSPWHIPGAAPDEYEQALACGAPLLISDDSIMSALSAAGQPPAAYRPFCYGGQYFEKLFLLDTDGTLSEWSEADM